jgi:hypothetical protein
MKQIKRHTPQYGSVIDGDPEQPYLLEWATGICVLYSDYVQDVNERLEMIAKAIEADERGEDGITPTAFAVRALKVAIK